METLPAVTVFWKVSPPEFVTVMLFSVPTAPETVADPVVLNARFEVDAEDPVIDPARMVPAPPKPRVSVTPEPMMAGPTVTVPVPAPSTV